MEIDTEIGLAGGPDIGKAIAGQLFNKILRKAREDAMGKSTNQPHKSPK